MRRHSKRLLHAKLLHPIGGVQQPNSGRTKRAHPRHLIVKLGAIGDVVMALPAVKVFKERAGGEVHWMCGRAVVPLLRQFPFIDHLIEVNDKALLGPSPLAGLGETVRVWRMPAGRRYDACAVLYYDWRYRLLVLPDSRCMKGISPSLVLAAAEEMLAMAAARGTVHLEGIH